MEMKSSSGEDYTALHAGLQAYLDTYEVGEVILEVEKPELLNTGIVGCVGLEDMFMEVLNDYKIEFTSLKEVYKDEDRIRDKILKVGRLIQILRTCADLFERDIINEFDPDFGKPFAVPIPENELKDLKTKSKQKYKE